MSSPSLPMSFSQRAFPAHPRVDRYFASASAEAARHRVTQCLERGDGPALVLGVPGVGKTMLLETVAAELPQGLRAVKLAGAQLCTRRALLQAILHGLGARYRDREEGELRISLSEVLLDPKESGQGVALLVDEAQTLPVRLLEELRVLSNLAVDGAPRLRLVLAGTHALDEVLTSPELDAFNQRIAARCYLEPLTREETGHYVRAHVAAAGGDPDRLISGDAYESIVHASDGLPRLVNQVCDRAIVLSLEAGRDVIDCTSINEAWSDLHQLAAPWQSPGSSKLVVSSSSSSDETNEGSSIEYGVLEDDAFGEALLAEAEAITATHAELTERLRDTAAVWNADEKLRELEVGQAEEGDSSADADDDFDDECVAYTFPSPPELEEASAEEETPTASEEAVTAVPDDEGEVDAATEEPSAPNPFAEEFDEEEVVLDPFSELERVIPAAPAVAMLETSDISEAFAHLSCDEIEVTVSETVTEIATDAQVEVSVTSTDDDQVLIVEADEPAAEVASARREEYSQLFAQLRQG